MREVVLRVRGRLLLARDGAWASNESVFCPARGGSVGVAVCKECAHAHSVTAKSVVCTPPGPMPAEGMDAPCATVALPLVTLVRADVPGAALLELSKATPWHLPVVDDRDRFVGFVSSGMLSGLLQGSQWPWRRIAVMLAHELVAGASSLVLETEPLGRALRIMAHRGTRSLALVDPSGTLQGVLSDVDALRVMAQTQQGSGPRR